MSSSKDSSHGDERQPLLGGGGAGSAAAAGEPSSSSRGQQQQQQYASSSTATAPFLAPLASPGHHEQQQQDAQYQYQTQTQTQHHSTSATSTTGPTFSRDLYPVCNDPFRPENILQAKQRARRRFALTLVLGFLTWTMLGLLVGVIGGEGAGFFGGPRRPSHARWPGALPGDPALDGNITSVGCADFLRILPIQAIVVGPPATSDAAARTSDSQSKSENSHSNSLHRENGNDGPPYTIYRSKAYFHFGLTEEDGIFLLGRGRFSSGSVRYILEEPKSSHARDNITDPAMHVVEVEVVAKWNDRELLRTAKVCPLVRRPNDTLAIVSSEGGMESARVGAREYGIGIYTPEPDYPDQYRHLSFETIVRLPPSSSGLSALRSLSLRGPSFSPVEIAVSPVSFARVHLNTSNGAVDVMPGFTLAAAHVEAHTSNGRIAGMFNVSDSLRLESTNGPIEAAVNLVPILLPEYDSLSRIEVIARTTNGRVGLKYLSHPNDVILTSVAQSTNGEARVTHQPAFEGSYDLETSFGKGVVHAAEGTKDPAGLGRKRIVRMEKDDRRIGQTHQNGSVQWGRKETTDHLGSTIAHTSLGAVTIDFL